MSRSDPPPSPTGPSKDDALLLVMGDALPLPCVVALPADGRVLFANRALGTLLAVEAHYLVGDRLDRLFHDETEAGRLRAQLMTGEVPAQVSVTLRSHAGAPLQVSLCPASVALGADALAVLFFIPLTGDRAGALPSALGALRQAQPADGESAACLDRLAAALRRNP